MLRLIKPGQRRGNASYLIRGSVNGKCYEITTHTTNPRTAERLKAQLESKFHLEDSQKPIKYGQATHLYMEKRKNDDITKHEVEMHLKICQEIGEKYLSGINSSVAREVAQLLYPNAKASTRNRWVIRPIASVMHYASNIGRCPWVRFNRYREDKPKPRAVSKKTASLIIKEAKKQTNKANLKHLICLWMFKHGNRISEIISMRGEDIDLKTNTFKVYISKTRQWKEFTLDGEVKKSIMEVFGKELPSNRIFPWTRRWSVYKWLRPMCRKINIEFTPHVARHSLGTWYAAEGAGLRATMSRLGHEDVKSSMRYQNEDMEATRDINRRIGKIGK